MGAVPAVLDTNPFAVGLDEAGGALAVGTHAELADAIVALLGDPPRLARMAATAMASARDQVDWGRFVEQVAAALAAPRADPRRDARAAIGKALCEREAALAQEPRGG